MTVGERIKKRRLEKGLSQGELGKLIHKSMQVISNWERGYTPTISHEDLVSLATALDVTVDYLVWKERKKDEDSTNNDIENLPPDWLEHLKFIRRAGSKLTPDEMQTYIQIGKVFARRIEAEERQGKAQKTKRVIENIHNTPLE